MLVSPLSGRASRPRRPSCADQIRLTSVIDTSRLAMTGGLRANLRLLTPWTEMLFVDLQHTPTPASEITTRLVGSMGRHSAQLRSKLVIVQVRGWRGEACGLNGAEW